MIPTRAATTAFMGVLVISSGCDQHALQPMLEDDLLSPTMPEPSPRIAPIELDCQGMALPACPGGFTGASCNIECVPGVTDCSLHYYCHADGRVFGLGTSGTYLFLHAGPSPTSEDVRTQLEAWVANHEVDLGLPDGLDPMDLRIEVSDPAVASPGLLDLYRFHQYYDADGQPALVVGDGSMITVESNALGVLAVKGTIIDPRVPYAHSVTQASETQAISSIQRHVALRLGVPTLDVTVDHVGLVAVPGANIIGWQGTANINGQVSVATVIVEADPSAVGLLPLVSYQAHSADGLANTQAIDVISEDLSTDIITDPISEALASTLFNGSDLLGSTLDGSMDVQLATERVVTLDLHGGTLGAVAGPADFDRFTDATGSFGASQPTLQFDAQRYHHLATEAYTLVDYVTVGAWDSARPNYTESVPDPMDPMQNIEVPLSSDYPPGQFQPRIINTTNHAPLGGPSGQASYALIGAPSPIPELLQQPGAGLGSEVIAYIRLPPGSAPAQVYMHELGHAFDVFLAPGFASDFIPICDTACDTTCDEDTSDEALPLRETIAQLFSLWQFQRIAGVPHDDCGVISDVMTGGGQGSTLAHHPSCMGALDEISMFIRPDDPACLDSDFCDKPSINEVQASNGPPYACDATEGYNVTSILQVWWNALHGQYCEPVFPFTCSTILDVAWPPGCDAPGSTTACATSDEVVGLALIYATRTNPLSYEDFLDSMATFVACNYGANAYAEFNQALCDHQLRDCDEPVPTSCQTCGNGLREGSEQCDGLDLSIPELGVVPTCEDHGFSGGTLLCDMSCNYDFSQCTNDGFDSTATGSGTTDGPTSSGSSTTSAGTGTSSTAGSSGGGGCGCRADGGPGAPPWLLLALLGLGRRRPRRQRAHSSLRSAQRSQAASRPGLAALAMVVGCGPDDVGVESSSSGSGSTNESSSSGELETSAPATWPEDSYGAYYLETTLPLGVPGMYVAALSNLELRPDGLFVTHLSCLGESDDLREQFAVEYEAAEVHVRPREGDSMVMWRGGPLAAELVFRPGATCNALQAELVDPDPASGYPSEWLWYRGALVITDTCDSSDDVWAADLRPDVPTDCGSGG